MNQARITLTAALGTMLEWAEYIFYGYLASHISHLFFPHIDKRAALLASFAVFAIGFLARPLGGIIFGHIGDKVGRRRALTLAMLTMGSATFLMGSLPTYASIGIAAPILLVICRLFQGLAVSGEYNGAAIFLIEHHCGKTPHLAGSWIGAAAAAGMLLGAGIVTLVTLPSMPSWAWRIPFWLGAVSCLVGFYLRTKITETPDFIAFQIENRLVKLPIIETIKSQPSSLIVTAALAAFVGIQVYICNLYFVSYLIHQSHFTASDASLVAMFGNLVIVICLPIMGRFADSIDDKPLMFSGLFLSAMTAPIIYHLGSTGTMGHALMAQLLYGVSNALICGPMYRYLFDLFPTNTRYTGTTFAWSVSIAIFGGTSPMLAEYLVGQKHFLNGPAVMVSVAAMVAFLAMLLVVEQEPETQNLIA